MKLKKVSYDNSYICYSASLDNKITVSAGKSQISILLFINGTVKSASREINLSYDDFTMSQRIQFFENVSKDIVNKYYQIEEMTKMNIEIYQQMEEGMFK